MLSYKLSNSTLRLKGRGNEERNRGKKSKLKVAAILRAGQHHHRKILTRSLANRPEKNYRN
jgi:hypothetical protein